MLYLHPETVRMASILVVGQEQRSLERFHRVLSAEGWRVRVAQGRAQALQAAAAEPPDLVLAAADVPGAEELAGTFRRSAGGPGIVVVMPEGGATSEAAVLGDERLRQPFAEQDLVGVVRRMLTNRREPTPPAAPTVRLTSQDIFGDVLAEVEGQLGGRTPYPPTPPGLAMPNAAAGAPPRVRPATPAAPPSAVPRPPSQADGDLQRKLERTLSGVLGPAPRSPRPAATAPGAAAARRAEATEADVDALLSKTLAELGGRPARATTLSGTIPAPAPARPAEPGTYKPPAPPTAATPPAPPATSAPSTTTPTSPLSPSTPPTSAAPTARPPMTPIPPAPAAAPPQVASPAATASFAAPLPPPAVSPASNAPAASLPAMASESAPRPPAPPPASSAVFASSAALASAGTDASSGLATSPAAAPVTAAAGEGTGVRRRFTGEVDLSQIEELARTRRRPDQASRPGVPGTAPGSAAQATPAGSAPPAGLASSAKSAGLAPSASSALSAGAAPPAPPAPPAGLPAPPKPVESAAATQRIQMVPRPAPGAGVEFGQYTLLDRIAVGGMAEVWKARMRGVEGFQKTVAIKKILPYMMDNVDFVNMFIDEAKLAAQLGHPNIVHIYDLGKIGANFYIAMEYVEGKDLRSLLNAGRQRGLPLPLGLALLIAVRLASALDYAHRKRDFEGREMGLVHRDVSPQNVLISFDGDVKLCDFGIAKAVSKVGQTHTGALKGKLQYMSPEQAMGAPVDARSDVFSLGTVLFEMLTGERLFDGDSEMSVLEAVRQVKVRSPRQVDPTIPREVDDIVMRCLAGRPEDRFPSAGEMEERLLALLYALKPSPSHSDLAAYLHRVLDKPVPAMRGDDLRAVQALPATASAPLPPSTPAYALPAALSPPAAAVAPVVAGAAVAPPPSTPMGPALMPPVTPPGHAPSTAAPSAAAAGTAALPPGYPGPSAATLSHPSVPHAAAPLAALDDAALVDGSRRGHLYLYAAIAALLLIVVLTLVVRSRRNAAGAAAVPPSPARAAGVATPPAGGTAAAGPAVPGGPSAALPGAKGGAAVAGKVDVDGIVNQELARREQALKQKLDEQQKQLQKELAATKGAKPADPRAAQKPTTGAGAASPAGSAGSAGGAAPPVPGAGPSAAAQHQAAEPRAAEAATAATAAVPSPPPAAAPESAPQETAKARSAEAPARPPADAGASSANGNTAAAAAAEGGVTIPPKLVSSAKPEYPPLARKLRVEGVVVLSVLVDEQGHVVDLRVQEPSSSVGFNEAAVQAARGAVFKPATKDGVPVKMWARLRIPFKLNQ
jgi:TonB family protein